jgi:2-oxoglutarate ferredoxin oxidoreductase subunit beta
MKSQFERQNIDIAWCPGCGNFGIHTILKRALDELQADKRNVVFVSGIGQAAKAPHYLDVHMFDGLHGRAVPVATAIKAANPNLVVVAEGGDGDMYGEGGNHFLNAIRRNCNIVHLVHNNMVYGLTKGQASPTSLKTFATKVQVHGVSNEPFNPLSVALALRASFVSRIYVGHMDHAVHVVKEALLHPGYALVDIFQPCVTFNKLNTYKWFAQNSYLLDEAEHDPQNHLQAMEKALQEGPFPLGIFYQNTGATFEENIWHSHEKTRPLYARTHDTEAIQKSFDRFLS